MRSLINRMAILFWLNENAFLRRCAVLAAGAVLGFDVIYDIYAEIDINIISGDAILS